MQFRDWPVLDDHGFGSIKIVDCESRHHASTDPHEWEERQLEGLLRETETYLHDHPAPE